MLLIVSLGLDWYGGLSGFNSFEFLDLLLVVLALVTLVVLAAEFGLLRTQLREGTALVVGVVALVVVASQLVNHPPAGYRTSRYRPVAWAGRRRPDARGAILSTARIAIAVEPRRRAQPPDRVRRPPPAPPPIRPPRSRTSLGPDAPHRGCRRGRGESPVAEAVGGSSRARGAVVVCGGLGGVMEAACRGAKEAGGTRSGILPGTDRAAANPFVDTAVPTGLGEARNALVVRAADALIAVGGGYGTLSEIALALKAGKPVVGLDSWDIEGVVAVADPAAAVAAVLGKSLT